MESDPSTMTPGTHLPGTPLLGTPLPGTHLPVTPLPVTHLPGTPLPGTYLPGTYLPGVSTKGISETSVPHERDSITIHNTGTHAHGMSPYDPGLSQGMGMRPDDAFGNTFSYIYNQFGSCTNVLPPQQIAEIPFPGLPTLTASQLNQGEFVPGMIWTQPPTIEPAMRYPDITDPQE